MGDSFTEGVGDRNKALPNGVRGWADRVAEKLAKAEPGWEYANLAVRSKRLRHIVDEQLDRALAMEPTLITLYAGGNDILDFGTDMDQLMAEYERLVARLAGTGATLVLFTGYDVKVSAVLEPFKKRNALYNERVRELATRYGAVLVDYWCLDAYHDRRMWASDRLHMSKPDTNTWRRRSSDHLGVPHKFSPKDWEPPQRAQAARLGTSSAPLGERLGPALVRAKASRRHAWGQPSPTLAGAVKVPRKAGLRKLAERQAAASGASSAARGPASSAAAEGKAQNNGGRDGDHSYRCDSSRFGDSLHRRRRRHRPPPSQRLPRLGRPCRGGTWRRHQPQTQYANLALRGRRLKQIVAEQLEPALGMVPTLVSFHAGATISSALGWTCAR